MSTVELSLNERLRTTIQRFFIMHGKKFVIAAPYIWLMLFFFIPFLIVFKISFAEMVRGVPPYTELFSWKDGQLNVILDVNSYLFILEDALDVHAYAQSLKLAMLVSLIVIFIRQWLRIKAGKKRARFLPLFFSFLFYSFMLFVALRLISWFDLSMTQAEMLFFAVLLSTAITLGFSFYFKHRNDEYLSIKQQLWSIFVGTVVLFVLGNAFNTTASQVSGFRFNDLLDHGLMSLSLISAPIFHITTDLSDSIYFHGYMQSIRIATISTFFCILIGYPLAWAISRCRASTRNILLLLILLPSWTSFLIRIYAWTTILRNNGLLNSFLMYIGVIDQPLVIMNTNLAVYIGIVYVYLPFVVLPIYNSLTKIDYTLIEASSDLGCKPIKTFFHVILPLTKSGVIAGAMLVFIPAVGEYVIPELLGGSNTNMIGKVLWEEFFKNRDWPVASAVASVMLMILIVPIYYFNKQQNNEMGGR